MEPEFIWLIRQTPKSLAQAITKPAHSYLFNFPEGYFDYISSSYTCPCINKHSDFIFVSIFGVV